MNLSVRAPWTLRIYLYRESFNQGPMDILVRLSGQLLSGLLSRHGNCIGGPLQCFLQQEQKGRRQGILISLASFPLPPVGSAYSYSTAHGVFKRSQSKSLLHMQQNLVHTLRHVQDSLSFLTSHASAGRFEHLN